MLTVTYEWQCDHCPARVTTKPAPYILHGENPRPMIPERWAWYFCVPSIHLVCDQHRVEMRS